ncbi:MAG: acyl carrier protein [Clostridia bacterium]|nr:acyl carrier protein [Clostridia bacterium]
MVFEKIKSSLAEQLGIEESTITLESTFIEDLNIDSLDLVELILALEEEYQIVIPEEEAENLTTVGDVVNYVNNHI